MMHTHADGTRHHDHDHDHDRDHDHDHHDHGHDGHDGHAPVVRHPNEDDTANHTVRGGPPVLDIGGDIGAMVVRMDTECAGTELFLRSEHEPPIDVHTGVWTRPHGTASLTAAVFPELLAGRYWVLDGDGRDVRPVVIVGGELTELDLRRPVTVFSRDADTVAGCV
jgi:ABC-type Zn2+ transport system substrate-binding protein/surface adhesin